MLVWGGISYTSAGSSYTSTGYRYDPDTDTWTAMSSLNAPSPRSGHTAIWTGMEMIIWGGQAPGAGYVWLNDGARYNPATDTWKALSVSDAPEARSGHSAVWTGAQMLVWGGRNGGFFPDYPQAGGIYDPDTDSWRAMTADNAPSGRAGQTAVWTGTQLLVWGGTSDTFFSGSGGRYDPQTDTWTAISTLNAPVPRSGHTAVWTGTEMIVWGGYDDAQYHATGARYDPLTDTWAATTLTAAPLARWGHSAIWSGNEMIIWGGYTANLDSLYPRSGSRYLPGTDTWQYTVIVNSPLGRTDHTAIWTGTKMIMWGGSNGIPLNSGGVYIP
jgi:N-acetylneuraminic acid mutarotase